MGKRVGLAEDCRGVKKVLSPEVLAGSPTGHFVRFCSV